MAERVSALKSHFHTGQFGDIGPDGPRLRLSELRAPVLWQVAAWPDTLPEVAASLAKQIGARAAPGPLRAATGPKGTLLRIQPLVFWLTGIDQATAKQAADIAPATGTALDLSHSRTVIRIEGPRARDLLARGVMFDLRDQALPEGACATGAIHHVGVFLHRRDGGYDLYVPRGFAVTIWEWATETAAQWGCEVRG